MSQNDELLKIHILSLSKAQNYSDAKKEWILTDIEYGQEWSECTCGHKIKEKCYIYNTITQKSTFVGNICIKNFLGINIGKAFESLKKILEDKSIQPNKDLIIWAKQLGYIYDNEYPFLIDICRKKKLKPSQLKWLHKINYRITNRIKVSGC